MKFIIIAALLLPYVASAQVLIETKAERAERCATMTTEIEAAEKAADALIATEASTIARSKPGDLDAFLNFHMAANDILRPMNAIASACSVAAPATSTRAAAVSRRLLDSIGRVQAAQRPRG